MSPSLRHDVLARVVPRLRKARAAFDRTVEFLR
jgi:hypothetical protein